MAASYDGPEIHNARIWQSDNFIEVLNRSLVGYSDGTGGQADIVATMRPAAFGLATFDFLYDQVDLKMFNIAIIGGETLGRQTVPRSELFGAIVLI